MIESQTIIQKIMAAKAGLDSVEVGRFVVLNVDLVMVNDITGPPAIKAFEATGKKRVFDPKRVALVPDHFTPNKDIASAQQAATIRRFAKEQGTLYWEVGRVGVEHVMMPEEGLISPGRLILGADSHTCTYGALNALGIGVGSTDAGAAMATGKVWLKCPSSIRVELSGKLTPPASAKDAILTLIGLLGTGGARYQALEFGGPGLKTLSIEERLTMANMAVECGAKAGLFEADRKTAAYLEAVGAGPGRPTAPDPGAGYTRTIPLRLSSIVPVAAKPHSPDNIAPVPELGEVAIDQVVIGSCTNGRLSDIAIAAEIIGGRKVAESVRLIVIPGSQQVWLEAERRGYLKTLVEAGAVVSAPSCGPCLGGHLGILAAGEVCVSTTNRNFPGRMGHADSQVYLTSPATAAASALAGRIVSPEEKR